MSKYYFAYGSNMNPDRMKARGLEFSGVYSGVLRGYALAFNKRAADAPHRSYANVIYSPETHVEGVIYELADTDEIVKMDPFEGTPRLYSRELYGIETEIGLLHAWVYIANRSMISEDLLPARWYLDHLLAGEPFLSPHYFQQLAQSPCLEHEAHYETPSLSSEEISE